MNTMFRITKPSFAGERIVSVSGRKNVGNNYLKHIDSLVPAAAGEKERHFFCDEIEEMNYKQAKSRLTYDDVVKLNGDDNMSLCISPRCHLYKELANTDKERKTVFRNVICQVIESLLSELKVKTRWVSSIDVSDPYDPLARVLISKLVYDTDNHQHKWIKSFFPESAWTRAEPEYIKTNYIEDVFAQSFFRRAILSDDPEARIDSLIRLSRKYKVELPLGYYAFRYPDADGNLITNYEKMIDK